MQSKGRRLISFFRIFVLTGVAALMITSAALSINAQNSSVPPTAVQVAKSSQFAKRLTHPVGRLAPPPKPVLAQRVSRRAPGQGTYMYENGPINGNTDGWTINFEFIVSDTFTVSSSDNGATVTGMSFGAWLFPGDTLISAELSITSGPNGGTSYFNQTVNFNQQGLCTPNQFGFNVCTENTSFSGPVLNAGTYWVNLQNASVPSGDPVYWDENSGVGCDSPGCPSQAEINSIGSIPSESFTILGETTTTTTTAQECYQSQGNLQILSSFPPGEGGNNNGVTIDNAGNLYGTNLYSGQNSAGFAYKLARFADWLLDPLFSFFGDYNGGNPSGAIVGPNGTLYGGASGGIQNCGSDGSQYCGLVYNLTPGPTACLTALCSWNENVPYRFSSESDGSGEIKVSARDQEGNLYGTTSAGGTFDAGTVFELSPSGGGWTKTTLYSFTGGSDGAGPNQVLIGNNSVLYGLAGGGGSGSGVVFQLTPSGSQWTEIVLHAFSGADGDGHNPAYLVQDGTGNLYGIVSVYNMVGSFPLGVLFTLQTANSGWMFSENVVRHSCQPNDLPFEYLNNLAIDAAGNLYGTGTGGETYFDSSGRNGPPYFGECVYNYIFKASYAGGSWQYQDLDFLSNIYFSSSGSLARDTSGNLYGATYDCGTNGQGTVWEFSP